MKIRYISIMILALLLAAGALACGGGGSDDPVKPPGTQGSTSGASLVGRILDREGNPVGKPWASVKLTALGNGEIAPKAQPEGTGPDAGKFEFIGLPTGIPLVLEVGLFQISIGRNLGWIQQVTLTSSGTFDLGDIVLKNDFLDNGWHGYVAKEYSLAILNFTRSLSDRYIQADLSYSSSAYNGLGWVYGKRGKDNTTGLYYIDPDTGEWLDSINSYEWDQALSNFDLAVANQEDSDAWAGMGGTYLTLIGQANKQPVLVGPEIPFYAFISYYFDESEEALENALAADPDYKCPHDKITANDLRATLLFLRWIQGHAVTVAEVNTLAQAKDLNRGSLQLLEVMPDLITYNPWPQL